MTIGPDNLSNGGNGAAKTEERFAGQLGYRPRTSRDGGPNGPSPLAPSPLGGNGNGNGNGNGLGGNGHGLGASISGGLGGGLTGGVLSGGPFDGADEFGHRNGASTVDRLDLANPIASTLTQPKLNDHHGFDDAGLREPAGFRDGGLAAWLDSPSANVVDHPLLRGLLLELPPKGSSLEAQWLDRWFEAARSILELLYRFEETRD